MDAKAKGWIFAFSYYNIRLATEPRQHWELASALAYFIREALAHTQLLAA